MGKHRRLIFALFLIAILGGLAWFVFGRGEPEPVYQGRTLSQWLEYYSVQQGPASGSASFVPAPVPAKTSVSDDAFRAMGTNAIPYLLRALRQHDSAFTVRLVALARRQSLVKIHYTYASERRGQVICAFRALGIEARGAVPELIHIYKTDPDFLVRGSVPYILAHVGADSAQVVPALIQGATDTNESGYVRICFMAGLGLMHSKPDLAVPALAQILKDPSAEIRMEAVIQLYQFGPDARPALPALFELLKTQSNDPKAVADLKRQGQSVYSANVVISGTIQQIDPKTAAARKSEIDAALKASEEK